jgi:streptogramin lyase
MKKFIKLLYLFTLLLVFTNKAASQNIQNREKATVNSYITTDLLEEKIFPEGMEGPSIDKNGWLYAVSYGRRGTIGITDIALNEAKLFLELPKGSTGNGIRFDSDGLMYVADYTAHNVLQIDPVTRKISILVHCGEMSQPNDLSISKKSGYIYLSDPDWTANKGKLWLVKKTGEVILLESDMGTTNGIEVSPDGKILYVNESNQRNIWKYVIDKDGLLKTKKLMHKFSDFGMDGMRCDSGGNLYVARYGAGEIVKFLPSGRISKIYKLQGKNCTNITLSNDEKRAYVTMQDRGCFEVINL